MVSGHISNVIRPINLKLHTYHLLDKTQKCMDFLAAILDSRSLVISQFLQPSDLSTSNFVCIASEALYASPSMQVTELYQFLSSYLGFRPLGSKRSLFASQTVSLELPGQSPLTSYVQCGSCSSMGRTLHPLALCAKCLLMNHTEPRM